MEFRQKPFSTQQKPGKDLIQFRLITLKNIKNKLWPFNKISLSNRVLYNEVMIPALLKYLVAT